ncbi:2-acylglycerol O-acyltransferase 1 [Halyomorpha halys]|uniref:2-acylglycerol O-acyltransferase 1 n=1 Tax=Halyomorpha halys TaxID=286706 RepID=UPI0006D50C61|nr:2-acylglycerol O-acyltransferase 1-like [Halyomorpha halys]XP_014273109.1 2-acylglycerol O-acyltransferase 1-like [Halyomorpha halys]
METMGIKFAPLNTPLNRRIETLSAFFWFVTFAFGNFVCFWLAAYLIFFTSYWLYVLLYIGWAYYDRETPYKGGRKFTFLQNLPFWKYFNNYFPINLEKTADLTNDRNYLFCCHPHGILCAGMFGNFASGYSKFKSYYPGFNVYSATLDLHFRSPFFREYCLGLGAVSSAKESIQYILDDKKKGNILALAVGGAAESFYAKPGSYRIVLKKRKGFIRIALEVGCSLVPVFSFGETDLYDQVPNPPGSLLNKMQNFMKDLIGFAPILPKGRGLLQYSFGIVPMRTPLTTVVGKPIELPKTAEPSDEIVQKYHAMYTEALIKLFNEHKTKYLKNAENISLVIE